jgi:hypothetical protein
MSINACSINSFTIDARRCRSKFNDLVSILHPEITKKASNGGWRIEQTPQYYQNKNLYQDREHNVKVPELELDTVTVSISILGVTGTETCSIINKMDYVSVNNLKAAEDDFSVNITNLRVS